MEIVRDTPFEVGYTVFQVRPPQNALIVVVKATFDLRSDGECTIASEQKPLYGDQFTDDDATRDQLYPNDLAPAKPRGEYFVLGTCHPPGGSARTSAVAFRVGALQKALAVFGDRFWSGTVSRAPTEPQPFSSMPLRWDRAFGGPGIDQNPCGRGVAPVETPQGPRVALPNIEHPQMLVSTPADRPLPACPRPVSSTWLPRRAQQGTFDKRWFEARWPWFPEDFRLEFFNSAPGDQQLRPENYWRGDEEIALKNLHPERPQVNTRLPALRPRAFVLPKVGGFREVPLQLDTIIVDADQWQVQCVWRGNTEVRSLKPRELAALFVGHESIFEANSEAYWQQRHAIATAPSADEAEPETPPETPPEAPPEAEPDELDALVEAMRKAGVLPPAEPPPAVPPPPPQEIPFELRRDMLAATGVAMTPEIEALLRDDQAEAPTPPPAHRDLRAEVLAKIERGAPLAGEDYSEGDLSELDLSGQDLTGTVFLGANLRGSKFVRARLGEAQLGGADLSTADFTAADLSKADFTEALLDGAVLDECTVSQAVFDRASLRGARANRSQGEKPSLAHANLQAFACTDAELADADLTGASIDDADFTRSKLERVTLAGTTGLRVRFDECDLTEARADEQTALNELMARYVRAPNATFRGGEYNKSTWSFSELGRADFGECALVQARFDGCILNGAIFEDSVMVGASAVKANLAECTLDGADLSHADLRGSNLHGAGLWRARLVHTDFSEAIVTRTQLTPNI